MIESSLDAVTLLVTHYNRSQSLERLLECFRKLDVAFDDIVVSDDGSKPLHLDRLRELAVSHRFRLVTTPANRGLGHNINKGQDAVKTPFTLYVQEDFQPAGLFTQRYADARAILRERPEIDVVRLYDYVKYPHVVPYRNGFSQIEFSLFKPGSKKFFAYSDTPHLRRSSFFAKFGRYAEGIPAIQTEKHMVMSFLQARGRAMVCSENDVFFHENTEAEPSTQDYGAFFAIKRRLPDWMFDLMWTGKLTLEYAVRRYRHD